MVMHDLAEAEERRTLGYRFPDDLQPLFEAFKEIYAQYTPSHARYLQVHRWHLMRLRPEEEPLATAALIKRLTLTGTKQPARRDSCLTRRRLCAICGPYRYGHETMVEEWAEVLAGV